jgi:hypothetical protein
MPLRKYDELQQRSVTYSKVRLRGTKTYILEFSLKKDHQRTTSPTSGRADGAFPIVLAVGRTRATRILNGIMSSDLTFQVDLTTPSAERNAFTAFAERPVLKAETSYVTARLSKHWMFFFV